MRSQAVSLKKLWFSVPKYIISGNLWLKHHQKSTIRISNISVLPAGIELLADRPYPNW